MFKLLIIGIWLLATHPVHVTLLSIEYSNYSNSFNVFLRVYYDDFLLDYKAFANETPDFYVTRKTKQTIDSFSRYLKEKIQIVAENQNLDFKITDMTLTDNELSIYLQYLNPGKPTRVMVRNTILVNIYNDQSNLLIFKYADFEEGVKLTPEKREHLFEIKHNL